MNQLITLALLAFGAYRFKDQLFPASTATRVDDQHAPADQTAASDIAHQVATVTNLPISNGLTPGVVPETGEIRVQPPATPTQATQATSGAYTPSVVDGNWVNAPSGAGAALQHEQQRLAGQPYWRPQVLPTPTVDMRSQLASGYSPESMLAAAASEKFENGGFAAFDFYSLPVGVWNYYRLQFDGGQDITVSGDMNREVQAREYWDLVRAHPIKPWNAGLIGLGNVVGWWQ